MGREICFADKGVECIALTEKHCQGCNFYKPQEKAIEELEGSLLHVRNAGSTVLKDLLKEFKEEPKWVEEEQE